MKKHFVFYVLIIVIFCSLTLTACGEQTDVKGIASIELTESDGLTDTYTITYTDGTTYNFSVTNGKDGADGIDGEDGANGINGTDGKDGTDGINGKDGTNGIDGKDGESASLDIGSLYDRYLENHPGATYEEFLNALSVVVNDDDGKAAAGKALQSAMEVVTEFTEQYVTGTPFRPQIVNKTAVYGGSAVIYKIDSDYTYIITNFHVVFDASAVEEDKLAKRIVCYLYGSEGTPTELEEKDESGCVVYDYGRYGIECTYVGGSINTDLAVIKAKTEDVLAVNPKVKAVEFADSYSVGQKAIAIGNSEGEGVSVTAGIISVYSEDISYSIDANSRSYRVMRIDTAIYHGNSGGGLFDKDGRLVGITNAGNEQDQNINYAMPLETVKSVVACIMDKGELSRVSLGITVGSANTCYYFDEDNGDGKILEDVVIMSVTEGGFAESLGLKQDDVIKMIKIGNTESPINMLYNLGDILYTARAGDEFSISYVRGTEEMKTDVVVLTDNEFITVS